MILAARHDLFGQASSIESACTQAASAGFAAIERCIDDADLHATDASAESRASPAQTWNNAEVSIAALRLSESVSLGLLAPAPNDRKEAFGRIIQSLDRARALGARRLILAVPSFCHDVTGSTETSRRPESMSSADHRRLLLEALLHLRFAAQTRATILACRMPVPCLWESAHEVRELMDYANSPWLGVDLDWTAIAKSGCPTDWIDTLGYRIAAIELNIGDERSVALNGSGFRRALRRTRFEGLVLVGGGG